MLQKLVKNKGYPCKVSGNNHKLGDYPITQDLLVRKRGDIQKHRL